MTEDRYGSLSIVLLDPSLTSRPDDLLSPLRANPVRPMEVLVIEEGDGSGPTVGHFPFPVLTLQSQRSRGITALLNGAAQRAEGSLLLFAGSDRPLQSEDIRAVQAHFSGDASLGAAAAHDFLAIRSSVFRQHGGFHPQAGQAYALELVARLLRAGVPVRSLVSGTPPPTLGAIWRRAVAWGRFCALRSERLGAWSVFAGSRESEARRTLLTPSVVAAGVASLGAFTGAALATLRGGRDRRAPLPGPVPHHRVQPSRDLAA